MIWPSWATRSAAAFGSKQSVDVHVHLMLPVWPIVAAFGTLAALMSGTSTASSTALAAKATVTVVEKRRQARDHPVVLGVPETYYLKCFILRRLE